MQDLNRFLRENLIKLPYLGRLQGSQVEVVVQPLDIQVEQALLRDNQAVQGAGLGLHNL